ncbi:hypothetical protein [Candidatus Methylobacter oryzae]|nr:hypothetical protein [Candidatus Methylobacter oryzae]
MKLFIRVFIFTLTLAGIMANAQATQQYMDYYQAPACTSCHTSGILNSRTGKAGLSAYLAAKTPTCSAPQVLQGNVCVTPAPTISDSDRIFAYLESIYPGYLAPAGPASSNFSGYYYRYYPSTNAYIATANGTVYYLGSASQNQIISLGAQADWLAKAVAAGF